MSYFNSYFDGSGAYFFDITTGALIFPQTPMVYDMYSMTNGAFNGFFAAYSANSTTRNTDTTYGYNSTSGINEIYDFTVNGTPVMTIFDTGGTDTLDLSGDTVATTRTINYDASGNPISYTSSTRTDTLIDIREGYYSSTHGMTYNIGIAFGTVIENVVGTQFNDTIYGNDVGNILDGGSDGNDTIHGGDGDDTLIGGIGSDTLNGDGDDDTLIGGAGADALDGGADNDTASYAGSNSAVNVNLSTGTGTGGDAQGDTLTNIENLIGSDHADTLTGDVGNNALSGGADDDTLIGGAGADALDGGADIDTASYAGSSSAVNVSLAAGTGTGGDAQGDTLVNIENLIGSDHNDTLVGGAGNNTLTGGDGNDYLLDLTSGDDTFYGGDGDDQMQGSGGADSYFGGTDTDEVRYNNSGSAVNVNLKTGVTSGGDAVGDTFDSVENLVGSQYADTLTGDDNANRLDGYFGDDILQGGLGSDVLYGGLGFDTADYSDSLVGIDVGIYRTGTGGTAQGDSLVYIEAITGSAYADTLVGAGLTLVTLNGGAGDDLLFDYGGESNLNGGAGNDTMIGRLGADHFDGGADNDTVRYADAIGAVDANLETGVGSGADAAGDTYTNVENLVGSIFFDTLTGDSGDNRLEGLGGRDILKGGQGTDMLYGGSDIDTFVYDTTDWGNDYIFDFEDGIDKISLAGSGLTFADFTVVDTAFGIRLDYFNGVSNQSISLANIDVSDISASDFI